MAKVRQAWLSGLESVARDEDSDVGLECQCAAIIRQRLLQAKSMEDIQHLVDIASQMIARFGRISVRFPMAKFKSRGACLPYIPKYFAEW